MFQSLMMGALGGTLIGLSVAIMMLFLGRITGISGIFGGAMMPSDGDRVWRVLFVLGLLVGGLSLWLYYPTAFPVVSLKAMAWPVVVVAGLFVGVGTRMGSGCTSGHGVCGLARLSVRSLVATITFIAAGALTVFLARHVFHLGAWI
ncbi:MAG: YeeE/YedE family protein [Myxococcales bacterium]|nr:YeeE/YedE family protein [Myxococcales bacterium]MCB9643888.1 YeeE/YedE family protein [Myxococcales bacterium]